MSIILRARYFNDTPVVGLYATLTDLHNPHVPYAALTDNEGEIRAWYGNEMSHTMPVWAGINSQWRMTFHVDLVYHAQDRPFNYIYTDFSVRAAQHSVTLRLAPQEYTVGHGQPATPPTELIPASFYDSLVHPIPVQPQQVFFDSPMYSPREMTPDHTGTTRQGLKTVPQRLSSSDFVALFEDSVSSIKPSRKRKRDVMEGDSASTPILRRSQRLLAKN
jgi:hypothetical protein